MTMKSMLFHMMVNGDPKKRKKNNKTNANKKNKKQNKKRNQNKELHIHEYFVTNNVSYKLNILK